MFRIYFAVFLVVTILLAPASIFGDERGKLVEIPIAEKDLQQLYQPYLKIQKTHTKVACNTKEELVAANKASEEFLVAAEPVLKVLKKEISAISAKADIRLAIKPNIKATEFWVCYTVRENKEQLGPDLAIYLTGKLEGGKIQDLKVFLYNYSK